MRISFSVIAAGAFGYATAVYLDGWPLVIVFSLGLILGFASYIDGTLDRDR